MTASLRKARRLGVGRVARRATDPRHYFVAYIDRTKVSFAAFGMTRDLGLLYFTSWFPRQFRGRVIAALFLAVPGSNAITAVLSGALLRLDGALDMAGWKWLYLVEAVPAVLLAVVVPRYMTDRPEIADWLRPDEKSWLARALERERQQVASKRGVHVGLRALLGRRVMALSAIYFTIVTATYGITFFLPQIVKGLGGTDMQTGLLATAPYALGTIGMVVWSQSSERTRERKWHSIGACLLRAAGLAVAGHMGSTYGALVAVASVGIYGSKPSFWPLPSEFLTTTAAAGGIALVRCVGNLGGFLGPYVVGWIKDSTGTFEAGLDFLAAAAVCSALIAGMAFPSRASESSAQAFGRAV